MKTLLFAVLGLVLLKSGCQSNKVEAPAQVAFYNVENLFDTLNTEGTNDGEYTPESKKAWNTEKYQQKLAHLNQVIASIDSNGPLAVLGLCEVENYAVVNDLVNTGMLASRGFKIVHQESPDFRGIDVAFLYDSNKVEVLNSQWLRVNLTENKTTREILRVDTKSKLGEVSFYVNHWPSRWGGTEKSKPKRIAAATRLRQNLDSLLAEKPKQKVVIMGDLNDYPTNQSVLHVLDADSVLNQGLYNATWDIHKKEGVGTHAYKGHWGVLDHIIISNNLAPLVDTVYVHKKNFMCYQNRKGEWMPSRTYSGKKYYGGYSDHMPIVLKLK